MIAEYKTKLIDKSILQRKLAELYDIAEEEVKNSQQDWEFWKCEIPKYLENWAWNLGVSLSRRRELVFLYACFFHWVIDKYSDITFKTLTVFSMSISSKYQHPSST